MMPTPEYPHDPEFPYLVIATGGGQVAKFKNDVLARDYIKLTALSGWKVIDTTPKPRIPVDAQFIMWFDSHRFSRQYASWTGSGGATAWVLTLTSVTGSGYFSEEELLETIGDAEITVLDPRKEES